MIVFILSILVKVTPVRIVHRRQRGAVEAEPFLYADLGSDGHRPVSWRTISGGGV